MTGTGTAAGWAGAAPARPLQNRVRPDGEVVADPGRGTLMGNRGCLHGVDRRLGKARWRSAAWISCVLDWHGARRDVMPPGRWTALFFLDEVTALAAGHRPCGYCRRPDFVSFSDCWRLAFELDARPLAAAIDGRVHRERVDPRTRRQVTRSVVVGTLPDAVMIRHQGVPALLIGGVIREWSFSGYGAGRPIGASEVVELLTPPSIVAVLAAGYRPLVHPTAQTRTPG